MNTDQSSESVGVSRGFYVMDERAAHEQVSAEDDIDDAVAAAVAAASAGVGIVVSQAIASEKYNKLTLGDLQFDTLLDDGSYEEWIRQNLMCTKKTFKGIVALLAKRMNNIERTKYVKKHSFEKKVAAFLYYLTSQSGYREVHNTFGIATSWVEDIVNIFIEVVADMAPSIVSLPTSTEQWTAVEEAFMAAIGFPRVVGAIDGTILRIPRPNDYEGFYCRHGYPAINVQAIVDANGRFMSVDCRPGSYSDKKIWREYNAGKHVSSILPIGTHLLGDAGYTLSPFLLTPYIERECGGF